MELTLVNSMKTLLRIPMYKTPQSLSLNWMAYIHPETHQKCVLCVLCESSEKKIEHVFSVKNPSFLLLKHCTALHKVVFWNFLVRLLRYNSVLDRIHHGTVLQFSKEGGGGKYIKLYKRLKPLNYTRQKPPSYSFIFSVRLGLVRLSLVRLG